VEWPPPPPPRCCRRDSHHAAGGHQLIKSSSHLPAGARSNLPGGLCFFEKLLLRSSKKKNESERDFFKQCALLNPSSSFLDVSGSKLFYNGDFGGSQVAAQSFEKVLDALEAILSCRNGRTTRAVALSSRLGRLCTTSDAARKPQLFPDALKDPLVVLQPPLLLRRLGTLNAGQDGPERAAPQLQKVGDLLAHTQVARFQRTPAAGMCSVSIACAEFANATAVVVGVEDAKMAHVAHSHAVAGQNAVQDLNTSVFSLDPYHGRMGIP